MSKFNKAIERLRTQPKDYTFSEAKRVLNHLGFVEMRPGKTSGSRVWFFRASDCKKIQLHKPHPEDEMCEGAVESLYLFLSNLGEI